MLKWIKGGISAVTGIAEPEYGENYIHTVSKRLQNKQPYRPTTRDDFNWLAPEHTNVETVTFYFADLESGITGFAQIIHSCIMGLRTAAQFTFKIYTSNDPEDLNIWTSTKLKNFRIDGPNFYADGLSLELSEDNSSYHLVSTVCSKSEVDLVIKRLSPGAKCGDDPSTYYGDNVEEPWGSIRHVFWPRNFISGTIKVKKPVDVIDEDDGGKKRKKRGLTSLRGELKMKVTVKKRKMEKRRKKKKMMKRIMMKITTNGKRRR